MSHNHFEEGYIQVYTGNGKGKTTAAIGLTMRAIAAGMKVFFGQFMKNTPSGEHIIFAKFPDQVTLKQFGAPHFIKGVPSAEDLELALSGWSISANAIRSGIYDLVVLDELNVALFYNMLSVEEVVNALKNKPKKLEIVLTGRNAKKEIIDVANLVTEMKDIKHYFNSGVQARKGIEE